MPTFYRIVKSNPPTVADFLSYRALGVPRRRDTPELRESWEAVSVLNSLEAARSLLARVPTLGLYIAVLDVPDDGPVTYKQTGKLLAHFDLRGTPEDMLEMVQMVVPARSQPANGGT